MNDCDVCVIGSGAGGGPVALTLAEAGYSVVVLEKGPWLTEKDFYKDEIACCRRNTYSRNLREEFHVVEEHKKTKAGSQSLHTIPVGIFGMAIWSAVHPI